MNFFTRMFLIFCLFKLVGIAAAQEVESPCKYEKFKYLIGEPSVVILELELPENHRHISGDEIPVRSDVSRLSIMHSGTLKEAKTNPNSTIVGLICG